MTINTIRHSDVRLCVENEKGKFGKVRKVHSRLESPPNNVAKAPRQDGLPRRDAAGGMKEMFVSVERVEIRHGATEKDFGFGCISSQMT